MGNRHFTIVDTMKGVIYMMLITSCGLKSTILMKIVKGFCPVSRCRYARRNTSDIRCTDVGNLVSEFINIGDGHLPGSIHHRQDSTKSDSVNHALVMEIPVTSAGDVSANVTSVSSTKDVSTNMIPVTSTGNISINLTPVISASDELASTNPHHDCLPLLSKQHSTSLSSSSNVISKYLVQLTEKKKAAETRVTCSRVLTSAEGLAILREKEEKNGKKEERKKEIGKSNEKQTKR